MRLLDQNPQRERLRQLRIIDVLTRQFSRRFSSEIAGEMLRMVGHYELTGETPPASPGHLERLLRIEQDLAEASARAMGGRILDQGKSLGLLLETKFDFAAFFASVAVDWVNDERIRRRITNIAETTRNNVVNAVARGYSEGLGIGEIAKNIAEKVPSISRARGLLIARTESHGASNAGAVSAATETGLQLEREWISVIDSRTREISDGDEFDHVAMNGQTIPNDRDSRFHVPKKTGGTEAMRYPTDPDGSAGNVINCRCVTGFLVVDTAIDQQQTARA